MGILTLIAIALAFGILNRKIEHMGAVLQELCTILDK